MQVDEHHVLGPLLGIGQQFLLQVTVFLHAAASVTGSGDGPQRHLAVLDANQDLGG